MKSRFLKHTGVLLMLGVYLFFFVTSWTNLFSGTSSNRWEQNVHFSTSSWIYPASSASHHFAGVNEEMSAQLEWEDVDFEDDDSHRGANSVETKGSIDFQGSHHFTRDVSLIAGERKLFLLYDRWLI